MTNRLGKGSYSNLTKQKSTRSIPLTQKPEDLQFEWESEINFEKNDIHNKWHFCNNGNDKRAELASKTLDNAYKELIKIN